MINSLKIRFATLTLSVVLGGGTLAIAACTAPDPAAEMTPDVEIVTLYVGPETVDCVGVGPQTCLQVRYEPDGDYELFYSRIEGFEYAPGYAYELLVQKTPVENPPADGSSIEWMLVEVISQTPVTSAPEG
ncbi:DUF4377 domain-containing protein [Halomicronema sp. CCY15110]|uniref:DUF4377 domain-containing protein n=1 Tax=Halomicronema sp. CCY15110 TaxID=2767773 RepID=UPI001950C4FA|nr:DUF4377 domain-containing protein [Halomicronema sp. CCY15110]